MPDPATVLIVDDDREIVRGVSLCLEAAGYRMLTAGDAEAGIATAVANRPDIIVLDVRLPRRNGLSALSDLKRRPQTKQIPVVMLSASVVDQQAALDAGARFFLRKPYRGDVLVQAICAALGTHDESYFIAETHSGGAFFYD